MTFIVMALDELGDDFRPSEKTYSAPSGCTMEEALILAENWLEKHYEDIKERYPECSNIHIEPVYAQMSYTDICEYWYY